MSLKKYLNQIQKEFSIDNLQKKSKKRKRILLKDNENWVLIEQKRAMIDLDGTIHKYSKGWQDGVIYDEPFDGAKEAIDWLKNNGYEIVIYTTRASKENARVMGGDHNQQIQAVENWLKQNDIYFDRITAEKIAADFYIDDKAIFIKNGNWNAVLDVIKKRMKFKE